MWVPQPFFRDAVVLLADYNSFPTTYLAHMLQSAGVRVVGPFESEADLQDWLLALPQIPDVAVVALDAAREMRRVVQDQLATLNVPQIFLQSGLSRDALDIGAVFYWPWGAFQIAEALEHMCRTSIGD
jgi:hypothetical protein